MDLFAFTLVHCIAINFIIIWQNINVMIRIKIKDFSDPTTKVLPRVLLIINMRIALSQNAVTFMVIIMDALNHTLINVWQQ